MKKTLLTLLMILFTIGFIPVNANAATLSKKSITLNEGQTVKLKVAGTKLKLTWKSSNKSVAKVSKKGKVTAIKAGTCRIKVRFGKKTLKCKVTVKHKHSYTATTISLPTCTESGLVRWTCKCGNVFYETTEPGHDYVNGKCVECGKIEVRKER